MQNITDYLTKLRLQQIVNPLFPKQDNNLPTFSVPYTEEVGLTYLQTKPFLYLSCRYFVDTYYWEFVNSGNIETFEELEFLYLPVRESTFLSNKSRIPYFATWNEDKEASLVYPSLNYLIQANAVSWGSFYSVNVSGGFNHPFLPTFEFTGRVCLNKHTLLYEYQDTKGYYGQLEYQYLSPIRPTDLSYPLGVPSDSQLVNDDCLIENAYPILGTTDYAGSYQSKYTTDSYNKHVRFYLYSNSEDIFLLPEPPKLNYKGVVQYALKLVNKEPNLKLLTTESQQDITIKQNSLSNLIIT